MIKINVITNNKDWLNYIKRPNNYLDKKIKKINLEEKKLKRVFGDVLIYIDFSRLCNENLLGALCILFPSNLV